MNVADIYNSHGAEYPWGKGAMTRSVTLAAVLVVLSAVVARSACCQSNRDLQTFFKQDIGPTKDEITAIRSGQPVVKTLPSRTPSEVFLFGAVYIHAAPQSYIRFVRDFDRRRELPSYWALQVFSNPPRLSDLKDFSFDNDEVQALRKCTPGDCQIQLPASSIEELQRSINWDAVDVNEQVNRLLQKTALQRLLAYQRKGNQALGVYNDKRNPTVVPKQFAYMLTYAKALPAHLPDFYTYLLSYPNAKPTNVEDTFYWARVKFGLKPTLRVVQMVTISGNPTVPVAYAIAENSSIRVTTSRLHWISPSVSAGVMTRQPGFYPITTMGSEQAGLTGARGSVIRKAAAGRSVSPSPGLTAIKNSLDLGGVSGKVYGASQVRKNQRPVGRPKKASLDMNMMNTAFLLRLSPGAELRLILMLFLFPAEWGAALSIVVLFLDIKRALSGRKSERGGRHP